MNEVLQRQKRLVGYLGAGFSLVPTFRSISRMLAGAALTVTFRVTSRPSCSTVTTYFPADKLRKIYAPFVPVFISSVFVSEDNCFNRTVTPASGAGCNVVLS